MNSIIQNFSVEFDFPVHFTRSVFSLSNPVFRQTVTRREAFKRHRVFFVIDANVARAHPQLVARIRSYMEAYPEHLELLGEPCLVPGGEAIKNDLTHVLALLEKVNALKIDRQSVMAIIGGGAVLDMGCFAAALSHRGIRALRIPTTVLSQNDSGVGVKNGINFFGKKNFVGTFVPPFGVINDFEFLETLDRREAVAGISEAVKVGLIRDRLLFDWIEAHAERLAEADRDLLPELIWCSAAHHLEHIRTSGDPFEFGSARPLDFGHWAAHKLESLTNYQLRHGEAVSIGIALDSLYSCRAGFLGEDKACRVLNLLRSLGLPVWDQALSAVNSAGRHRILEGLEEFREHLGGELHVTLLQDIGRGFEVSEMAEPLILEAIGLLEQFPAVPYTSTESRNMEHPPIRRAAGR